MSFKKRTALSLLQFFIAFLIGIVLNLLPPDVYLCRSLTIFYYMIMSVYFTLFVKERLIHRSLKRVLVHIAIMIGVWFTLIGFQKIAFIETSSVSRFFWYFTYLPVSLMPYMLFYGALYEGKLENERLNPLWYIFTVYILGLNALILTNDFHQLVFKFPRGINLWRSHYVNGPLYYVLIFSMLIMFLVAFFMILNKCRIQISRELRFFPLIPLAIAIVFGFFYALDLDPIINGRTLVTLPEVFCYLSASFLSCCMSIGLFPTNRAYVQLFGKSSISALITDYNNIIRFESREPISIRDIDFKETDNEIIIGNMKICRHPIRGGFVYWSENIEDMNLVNMELKEQGERLSEEADLIMLTQDLDKERISIEESNKLYDNIAKKVLPQSQKIAELSAEAEEDLSKFEKNAGIICVLCTYIKRYANLTLLSEKNEMISSSECALAIKESLRSLERIGIITYMVPGPEIMLPSKDIISLFEMLETIIEEALPNLKAITIRFDNKETPVLKIILEGVKLKAIPDSSQSHGSFVVEDKNTYITYKHMKGVYQYDSLY